MREKKLELEKSITRDWCLIYGEIWHRVFTKEFKKQIGWGYTEVIFEGKKSTIAVYRSPREHIDGMRDFILSKIDMEEDWFKRQASAVIDNVEKTISWIKK